MANITDKVTDTRNAARPNSARVSSSRSAGASSLSCDSLSGWPTASKVHFVTYQIDSNSALIAGSQLDCSGIVSGNNIGSFTVLDGTDSGHSIGDVVEMLPTASWGQDLADAFTSEHSRTGGHGAINTTSITNSGSITSGSITNNGALTQTGVAIFTAVPLLPNNTIETADIQNASVTADKLGTGAAVATVATGETTSSTTAADLSTTGPSVTVTIGANGLAFVSVSANYQHTSASIEGVLYYVISGATTVAATQIAGDRNPTINQNIQLSGSRLITGLTPGSNTFKLQYSNTTGATATFGSRFITVLPL